MIELIFQTLQKIGYSHPLHPVATHVPVGLIIGGFVFICIAWFLNRPVLSQTARHCMLLALIALLPTVLLGYMDWQHFYAGAWLFYIKMKLSLAGLLLVLLSIAVVLSFKSDKSIRYITFIYALCLLTVVGLGYFGGEMVYGTKAPAGEIKQGLSGEGAKIFDQKCSFCHFSNKTETKVGPGLKGLFSLETMPTSGMPISDENIRKQLKTPFQNMPPFDELPEEDIESLILFLKTL